VLQRPLIRLDIAYAAFRSGFIVGFFGISPANPEHFYVGPFSQDSPERPKLAAAFLDEAHCAGADGLSEADKAKLKEIAAPAAPQPAKP
jgi:hypothetical protein